MNKIFKRKSEKMLPEDKNTLPLPAEADAAVAGAASAMAVSSGKKLVNLTVLP